MDDGGPPPYQGDDSSLIALSDARKRRDITPVAFHRTELDRILRIYSIMVAANEWRDYAIDHMPDRAIFSVYRRTSDVPLYQIIKEPRLAARQGAWRIVAADGQVLKRGHELVRVLAAFDKPLKLIKS